jgi:hypothetical protein
MATKRLNDPIEPMMLQIMRENGVRSRAGWGALLPPLAHEDEHRTAGHCKDQYDREIFEHEPSRRGTAETVSRVNDLSSGKCHHRR